MPESQTLPKQNFEQPRGAGSGDKANATRSRNIVDWPPPAEPRSETVDRLVAESEAQADFNTEMADKQAEQAKAITEKILKPSDPADADKQRDDAMKAYEDSSDPKKKEARLKGEMDARAKRDKAAAEAK